ncbi:MAG: helix-turn-helix domain-containing protein [Actinobacteria bacterium]|nr:helix-turn-helix domain-containing protein [Actinomycetota bacterium]
MTRTRRGLAHKDRAEAIPEWSPDEGAGGAGARAEIGPGCPVFVQLGSTLYELRLARHEMRLRDLARMACGNETSAPAIARVEMAKGQVDLLMAIGLAGALEVDVDEMTAGIFWNPGETAASPSERRPPSERLRGYFSTVPTGMAPFEEPEEISVVGDRREAAAILGANVRGIRERRHRDPGRVGLWKGTVSNLERGGEADLDSIVTIVRTLEVPPELAFQGMLWETRATPVGAHGPGDRRDRYSSDAVVARLWREDFTSSQIAHRLGIGENAVKMVVRRLRARGRYIPYRQGRGTLAVSGPTEADLADERLLGEAEARAAFRDASAEEVKAHVGARVRELRERAGLTLQQLGDATEFQVPPLSKLETRGLDFKLTTLVRLAAGLNVPCSAVIGGARWDVAQQTFRLPCENPSPASTTVGATVGANARRIRRSKGLSRPAVAARIDASKRYVAVFETSPRIRAATKVVALAAALGVGVGALLDGVCDWYVRPLPPAEGDDVDEVALQAHRVETLLRLWGEGHGLDRIALELGMSAGHVSGLLNRLRAGGVEVPYRNRPASPAHLRTRLRRRRAARPRLSPGGSP